MTIEVDPDVWLFTRLAIGRGWRGSLNAVLWIGGIAAFASGQTIRLAARSQAYGHPNIRMAALFALMLAPSRPIARLIDLEHRGLLDHMRLCARSQERVLAAVLAGAMWPLLLVASALLAANGIWFHGSWATVRFGALAFVVMLDLGLLVFALSPARVRSGWVTTSALVFFTVWLYSVVLALEELGWIIPEAFDWRLELSGECSTKQSGRRINGC